MRIIEDSLRSLGSRAVPATQRPIPLPPPQLLCDDVENAHRAIATYDNWVAELERRLGSKEGGA